MYKTGAVEQDVEWSEFVGKRRDRIGVEDIEPAGGDKRIGEVAQFLCGYVGGEHIGTLGRESERRRPANPLPSRRHQGSLALKPSGQSRSFHIGRRQIATPEKRL